VKKLGAVQIFLFAAASPHLMRLRLVRVDALVSRPVAAHPPDTERVARTIRLVDSMLRLGSPVLVPGCVTRGLTLYYFLRRLGLEVSLVFGAGQVNHRFAAHCWLEKDSQPYLEKADPRSCFAAFYRFGELR
jgi:hypothetical protein